MLSEDDAGYCLEFGNSTLTVIKGHAVTVLHPYRDGTTFAFFVSPPETETIGKVFQPAGDC